MSHRAKLAHLEFRNVQSYEAHAPRRVTETRTVQSWECEVDEDGERATSCRECQAPLRIQRATDQAYALACRTHRRKGLKQFVICAAIWPFGVMVALLSAAGSHPLVAVPFLIGVLFAFCMGIGAIAGLVGMIGRPPRYSIVEEGEPQKEPTRDWKVAHTIR